jgi:uncharacterized protein YceH (UPF0502 family)
LPPILSQHEQRVLGCLLEKETLTPEAYPLTLNSLRLACNQKTSREPVMELEEAEVSAALNSLKGRDLVTARTDGRASKYAHSLHKTAVLDSGQKAAITLLLVRGAQTPGELRGRSGRLHDFESPAEVEEVLERLAGQMDGAWARRLERRPGEKEARWAHCLDGGVDMERVHEAEQGDRLGDLESRVKNLEQELAALRAALGRITPGSQGG